MLDMQPDFEAIGQISDWPANETGKPTQAAVFGTYHLERGRVCEILWSGKFDDLEPAMYWAAKNEASAVRRDKWIMASRVIWQHGLTPEQAVSAVHAAASAQIDRAVKSLHEGRPITDPEIGEGPMQKVDVGTAEQHYRDVAKASGVVRRPARSKDVHFEATGNMDDWPPNVAGKPTQAAVFGVLHPTRGKQCEILWTGQFPDLEPAMYWAAKKDVEAVRKGKWIMASRVLWQHELTPEQAVETCFKTMEPQTDQAIGSFLSGDDDIDVGQGPMRTINPGEAKGYYVEITKSDDPDADPIASFFGGPPSDENDIPMNWRNDSDDAPPK